MKNVEIERKFLVKKNLLTYLKNSAISYQKNAPPAMSRSSTRANIIFFLCCFELKLYHSFVNAQDSFNGKLYLV